MTRAIYIQWVMLAGFVAGCDRPQTAEDRAKSLNARLDAAAGVALSDGSPAAVHEVARLQFATGRLDEAELTYRKLLKLGPSERIARELTQLLHRRGRYVEAARVAEAWKVVPEKDEPSGWLAELLQLTMRARQLGAGRVGREEAPEIELVTIPAGALKRGRQDGPPDERPSRVTNVDSFLIGRFEVTVGQYLQFLQESGYRREDREPPGLRDPARKTYTVAGISWLDARAFTIWISARHGHTYRLPTEAEWEWAARGASGHRSPWGANGRPQVDGNWGRLGSADLKAPVPPTMPGGLFARDRSVFGVADMGGNVMEWCLDAYDATYFAWAPGANPYGPVEDEGDMVLRGWSWNHPGSQGGAATDRAHHGSRTAYTGYGFRVVRELERRPGGPDGAGSE